MKQKKLLSFLLAGALALTGLHANLPAREMVAEQTKVLGLLLSDRLK